MATKPLEQYEVVLRCIDLSRQDLVWSMYFQAESFAHAEEQAWDALDTENDDSKIITIKRDW